MVEIYTDASVSVKHSVATATCFILTTVNFIGCQTFTYSDIDNSTEAELQGVIDGLRYAETVADLSKEDVVLYSDFPAMPSIAHCNLSKNLREKMLPYKEQVIELQDLVKKYNVEMRTIRGHQKSNNPNKIVDFISNSVLRYKIRGV